MSKKQYAQISQVLQTVLEKESEGAGRETAFVQRQSKVSAARFVQMMVLGTLERADASLTDLVEMGEELGVQVSASGLNQRIDDEAVALLKRVLQATLRHAQAEAMDGELLKAFAEVQIEDSSYIRLPPGLAQEFRGSGGNASAACAKLYLSYEYRSGTIQTLELYEACTADQSTPLPSPSQAQPALRLFDLGFFKQTRLAQLVAQGDCFICRHYFQTALYTPQGKRLDLEAFLASANDEVELPVLLGAAARLPVRLLCQRVPPAVIAQRHLRIQAEAKRMRRPLSAQKMRLAAWNLFCTNVPTTLWSLRQVLAVYRLRWQVELLFKHWKSDLGLERLGNWRRARTLAQLYARLIALVLWHFLLAPLRFTSSGELSWPKALAIFQRKLPCIAAAIAAGWRSLPALLHAFFRRCQRLALKDKRCSRPSTYQHLATLGL